MFSNNSVESFDIETTRGLYEDAKENNPELKFRDPMEFDDGFVRQYTVYDNRAGLNSAVWYRNFPVYDQNVDKTYETAADAYPKVVRDAHFYSRSWEGVTEIMRRSYYPTGF